MSSTLVSDIESRIDIVELVREYIPLKKSGTNWNDSHLLRLKKRLLLSCLQQNKLPIVLPQIKEDDRCKY